MIVSVEKDMLCAMDQILSWCVDGKQGNWGRERILPWKKIQNCDGNGLTNLLLPMLEKYLISSLSLRLPYDILTESMLPIY